MYLLSEENFTRSNLTGTGRFVEQVSMTNKYPGIMSQLKIIQINIQHSKLASASLAQLLLDKQIDVAIIQEPYVSVQRMEKPFLYPMSHPNTLVSIISQATKCLAQQSSQNLVSMARLSPHSLTAAQQQSPFLPPRPLPIAMYARPSVPSPFSALSLLLLNHPHLFPNIIIGLDSNAKHPFWNSRFEDKKGQELTSVLSRLPLSVANRPISELSCIPSNTVFIDIILTGENISCSQWSFLLS